MFYSQLMRFVLQYLLLDGFDPDTAELALRIGTTVEGTKDAHVLRLRLHLGRNQDPLQPLRRELQTHLQMPLPALWDKGLRIIIRAIEDEMASEDGRQLQRYTWVRTQMMHPVDERRSTLNHPMVRQTEILRDWAQRFDQEGDSLRAMELYERMLLLSPMHELALSRMSALLREQGMIEEMITVVDRWLQVNPGDLEAQIRRGEGLLHLERYREAQHTFTTILNENPAHTLAHLGAAQAKGYAGSNPLPHLDAALELDKEVTLSVLKETYDYRFLTQIQRESVYSIEELPLLLGVTEGDIKNFIRVHGLPVSGLNSGRLEEDLQGLSVRESELSQWVTIQNRYQLLPAGLHWMAPTPHHIPDIPDFPS